MSVNLSKGQKVSLEKSTDESNSENQIPEQKKQKKALDFLKLELPTLSLRKKTDSQKTKSQNTKNAIRDFLLWRSVCVSGLIRIYRSRSSLLRSLS